MEQEVTLNLRYDWPQSEWDKIAEVYAEMDGWLEGRELPTWFGDEDAAKHISASVEPSGLHLFGRLDAGLWTAWLTKFCAQLTLALGRPVHDAEI